MEMIKLYKIWELFSKRMECGTKVLCPAFFDRKRGAEPQCFSNSERGGCMKYQDRQKRKRVAAAVVAVVIALAMIAGLVTPFIAYGAQTVVMTNNAGATGTEPSASAARREKEFGQEQFTLDAEVGFDGEFIVGKTALLKGVITNHGAAFQGELQAKVYTFENTDSSNRASEYAVYYQELELLEGASQALEMEINMGTIRRFLQVTLVDERGNTVFLQNIDLRAKSPMTLAVGVLSERPQDMQILAGMAPPDVSAADASTFYSTYFFDGEDFPASGALMDNFRIIVADGIDFASLSEKQREALCGWVAEGGMLVIGTGEAGERTLGGLEMTADISVSGTAAGSVAGTPVTLAVLEGGNIEPLWQENGTVLAYEKRAGEGRVILPAFSIATAPMAAKPETPSVLWELCRMADEAYLTVNTDGDNDYYYSRTDNFPPLGEGTVKLLLGFLACYVLIVGPVLYLILKKLDKREKGWVVIPAMAVLCMAVILLISKTSPYSRGMVRLVSTVELTEGMDTAAAETELHIKSADRGDVTYRNEEKLPLFPKKEEYYYYNFNFASGETNCGYKMLSGDNTEITFLDSQGWETNHLVGRTVVQTGGALESGLILENGRLKGTVTNGTNVGFVDSVLSVNGTWLRIGPIQAGDTVEVDEPAAADEAGTYQMFERLFYDDYSMDETLSEMVYSGKVSREEAYRIRCEENLLEDIVNSGGENLFMDGGMKMDFYGFSEAPLWDSIGTVNGKEPSVSALTLYHQTFTMELAELGEFDTSFAILPEAVETDEEYEWNSHWGETYLYPYQECDMELVYSIADSIDLELFQFEEIERNVLREKAEIYNVSTGGWDILRTREYVAPGEYDPAQYISEDGKVRLRLMMMEGTEVEVPKMRVKGRGLLAGN